MATYSGNTTLKVSAAVSASIATTSTSGTLYTCPANSYALLNVHCETNGTSGHTAFAAVAGAVVCQVDYYTRNNSERSSVSSFCKAISHGVIVGPGQSLTYEKTAQTTTRVYISGVAFINSP